MVNCSKCKHAEIVKSNNNGTRKIICKNSNSSLYNQIVYHYSKVNVNEPIVEDNEPEFCTLFE